MHHFKSKRVFGLICFSLCRLCWPRLPSIRLFHRRRFSRVRRSLSSSVRVRAEWATCAEFPKDRKDPRFAQLNLPDIETFAKSEKEKRLLNMVRAFRSIGTALLLPPGTPKDRVEIFKEAVRKTHTDPEFINEYRR
jgi:hypothetical protein